MCRKYHSNSCHCSIPAGGDSTPGCFCCELFPWWRAKDKSGFHPNCTLEWLITSYDKGKMRKKKLVFLVCVWGGAGSSSSLFILIYAFVCHFHLCFNIERTDWNADLCRCCCLPVHRYWHVIAFFLSIMQLVAIQLRLYLWLFFLLLYKTNQSVLCSCKDHLIQVGFVNRQASHLQRVSGPSGCLKRGVAMLTE